MTRAYFDCNATTPTLPAAAEAALEAMNTLYGNPSSAHVVGLQAKHMLESTRKLAARAVGGKPEQIIFTSGATEAIQTAVFSALENAKSKKYGETGSKEPKRLKLLYGATEHKAVPQALQHWVNAIGLPFEVISIPVDENGLLDLPFIRKQLPETILLCTMAVNNETGVIQDLKEIDRLLRETKSDALWLADCVQALGKISLGLSNTRIDYAPFSGHKFYAPKGIGFLYVSERAPIFPLMVGGGQERGLRSGTENLPGVAALGAVLKFLIDEPTSDSPFQPHAMIVAHRDRIVAELRKAFPKVEFNTPFEKAVPTTINFSIPGFSSKELMDLFDSAGLRLSAGSACSSAKTEPSYVLEAMGLPEWRTVSALRLSFGPLTSSAEIERGCKAIRESANALKHSCLLDTAGAFDVPENLRDGILQLRSGPSNTWVLADREAKTCVVVDPVDTIAERLEHYIRCQDLRIIAILDTHSHADHVSVRPVLEQLLSDQMVGGNTDALGWPSKTTKIRLENGTEADAISLSATHVFARVHTPGHTSDSHAYLFGTVKNGVLTTAETQFAFTGDTILTGGLGRTNFLMSDVNELFHSLRKIEGILGSSTLICPAHDYSNSFATRLETEVTENPLLKLALGGELQPFIRRKTEIDLELENLERSFQGIVCGVAQNNPKEADCDIAVTGLDLAAFMARKPLVIDVREPQEFELFKEWKALGLKEKPRNVPLTRFVNFMQELIAQGEKPGDILLLCRSGNRSLQAARSLRRLGLPKCYSLEGGLALLAN